jgi:hypothetical protein
VEAKAIMVVQENKVRGVTEKVYAISTNPYDTVAKDINKSNNGEILNLFYQYIMSLLGDFETYLQGDKIDLVKDGISFRSAAIYLSDEEFTEFLMDFRKAFDKVRDNGPASGRRLRKISTITMPGVQD